MLIPIRREDTFESMKIDEPFKSIKSYNSDPFKSAKKDFESMKSDAFKSIKSDSFKSSRSDALESMKPNPFNNLSALKLFESNNKRWTRDEFDDFLLPAVSNRSLLRDRIGDFQSLVQKDSPIQIDAFASESDKYVLTLNVKQFKPEELQVKITDQMISITAKHEVKQDEGNYSCQEFSRNHSLPTGIRAEDIKCDLSSDGVLTVTAPKLVPKPLHTAERRIPIQHMGQSAIKV